MIPCLLEKPEKSCTVDGNSNSCVCPLNISDLYYCSPQTTHRTLSQLYKDLKALRDDLVAYTHGSELGNQCNDALSLEKFRRNSMPLITGSE